MYRVNGLTVPVTRNNFEENLYISEITVQHRYKTTMRRYRGNFLANNSHGNIVPSPINDLSSHSNPSYINSFSWYDCHRVFILLLFSYVVLLLDKEQLKYGVISIYFSKYQPLDKYTSYYTYVQNIYTIKELSKLNCILLIYSILIQHIHIYKHLWYICNVEVIRVHVYTSWKNTDIIKFKFSF